ncbi:hypothetical protein CJ030_MR3G014620 [Morella rubra]|uniref:DUF674 domain-containing protein n=1 Tax=Morella rubra TaxID=262757 RepID=A0A6A1W586_9ROSI|nr:hypothetical protein CJ030_MR3G014620 [Morella rubra]
MAATELISLKLLIDMKKQRVIFAEAGKDFVDFLCNILTLPVGTVTRLLLKEGMVGSLQSLYESIDNLSFTYIQPGQNKDVLLEPKGAIPDGEVPSLLPNFGSSISRTYRPSSSGYNSLLPNFGSSISGTYRPSSSSYNLCGESVITSEVARFGGQQSTIKGKAYSNKRKEKLKSKTYSHTRGSCSCSNLSGEYHVTREVCPAAALGGPKIAIKGKASSGEGGYVIGVVTYMVMDDLEVKPMSIISGITLLNEFSVKELGGVEEKVVYLGMSEGLKLLKASLQSKTVLTDVFLPPKT